MDSERFDGLVRRFGQPRSRRQTLRGLAGAVTAGALGLGGGRVGLANHKPSHCAHEGEKVEPGNSGKGCCEGEGLVVGADGRCELTCDQQCAGCVLCAEKADGERVCSDSFGTGCQPCSSDAACAGTSTPVCAARFTVVGEGASFTPCPTSFSGPACVSLTPCASA